MSLPARERELKTANGDADQLSPFPLPSTFLLLIDTFQQENNNNNKKHKFATSFFVVTVVIKYSTHTAR